MKDQNLLDDNNINSDLPNSLLIELRKTERWHLITASAAFVLAVFCFFAAIGGIFVGIFLEIPFLGVGLIWGLFLTLFGVQQFRCSKAINWLDQNFTNTTLEDVYLATFKAWRAFGFVLLGAVLFLLLTFYLFFAASESKVEPMPPASMTTTVQESPPSMDTTVID